MNSKASPYAEVEIKVSYAPIKPADEARILGALDEQWLLGSIVESRVKLGELFLAIELEEYPYMVIIPQALMDALADVYSAVAKEQAVLSYELKGLNRRSAHGGSPLES